MDQSTIVAVFLLFALIIGWILSNNNYENLSFFAAVEKVNVSNKVVQASSTTSFVSIPKGRFLDERGIEIDTGHLEVEEQRMARTYIQPHHVVLELGARFGTVTYAINARLADKSAQVSVEPDFRVWKALEANLAYNDCKQVRLHKGFVSNKPLMMATKDLAGGYGASSAPAKADDEAPHISLRDLEVREGLKFTALVADCEGYLGTFLNENPQLYDQLELVIFEADHWWRCDYKKIRRDLEAHGFIGVEIGFQSVYKKLSPDVAREVHAWQDAQRKNSTQVALILAFFAGAVGWVFGRCRHGVLVLDK